MATKLFRFVAGGSVGDILPAVTSVSIKEVYLGELYVIDALARDPFLIAMAVTGCHLATLQPNRRRDGVLKSAKIISIVNLEAGLRYFLVKALVLSVSLASLTWDQRQAALRVIDTGNYFLNAGDSSQHDWAVGEGWKFFLGSDDEKTFYMNIMYPFERPNEESFEWRVASAGLTLKRAMSDAFGVHMYDLLVTLAAEAFLLKCLREAPSV